MKKSVFILRSNSVNPDPRVEKIAGFLESDYSVTIFAWDRERSLPKETFLFNRIPIIRFGPRSKFGTGYKGIVALMIWQINLLFKLIKYRKKIDIIHACDMDTVLPAYFIKVILKKKLVYDMFDHYAFSRSFPKNITKIICKLEDYFSYNADGLILVDDVRISQLTKLNPNTQIIYNSPKQVSFDRNCIVPLCSISYVGILQPHRYILELMDDVSMLKKWQLTIAGFGILEDAIKNKIQDNSLININYIGRVSYENGLLQSFRSEIMVAIYDPLIPNHKYASPNKYFEALMLGKIIIAAKGTHIDEEILKEQVGFVFQYGNSQEFKSILNQIENLSSTEKIEFSDRAKMLYNSKYSSEKLKNSIEKFYSSISN